MALFVIGLVVFTSACAENPQQGQNRVKVFYPEMSDDSGNLLRLYQHLADRTGVQVVAMVPNGTLQSQLDLLILGQNYPDMINLTGATDLVGFINEGFAQPLDDLIDQHAPNIKAFFEAYPAFKRQVTYTDGKIYNIPIFNTDEPITNKAYIIRQDWLNQYITATSKAANWEPRLPQEFTDMFAWWYNNITPVDSEGNPMTGTKVIPYFDRDARSQQYAPNLLGLFGACYLFCYDSNGDLQFGPEMPEFITALETARVWWQNGYMSPNWGQTTAANDRVNFWQASNRGGMTSDTIEGAYDSMRMAKLFDPNFDLKVLTPPSGWVWSTQQSATLKRGGMMITTVATDKVAAIKLLDWFFSEEGQIASQYGFEGDTYTLVDGQPTIKEGVTLEQLDALGVRRDTWGGITNNRILSGGEETPEFVAGGRAYNDQFVRYFDEVAFWRTGIKNVLGDTDPANTYQTNLNSFRTSQIDAYIQGVIFGTKNTTTDYQTFLNTIRSLNSELVKSIAEDAWEIIKSENPSWTFGG